MTHNECDCAETRTNATCDICEPPKSKSQLRREEIMNKPMTLDELLAFILWSEVRSDEVGQGGWKALRAVVELTKNIKDYWSAKYFADLIIQAIKKELK